MNFSILLFLSVFILGSSNNKQVKTDNNFRTVSFDEGWRFIKENPEGAEVPSFNDSEWRILDLPHDWSIEDIPGQMPDSIVGPFSKASVSKKGTGYTVGGTAWYRKHFTLNKKDKGNTAISPGTNTSLYQNISISDPVLWAVDNPKLYNARVTVLIKNRESDNLNFTR